MPSRKKRKRHRRRAEATATRPESQGGWGTGYPVTRRDLAMARRAIRENWPAPAAVRAAVIADICEVALTDDAPLRVQISAVRTVIDAEAVNQRADLAERAICGTRKVWPT
ncbi:MAG: hypothetical protein H0T51_19155 [Pirellulales bacterium]|nr:hypothetical protein [Pirellulales bacterium]